LGRGDRQQRLPIDPFDLAVRDTLPGKLKIALQARRPMTFNK
jgi:hypothetical protein